MQVKLDDLELEKRVQPSPTSPVKEVRSVTDVQVDARRSLVELPIPGSKGNVLQDMGREPVRIEVQGEFWGPDSKKTLESLKTKSDSGESVSFESDLLAAAQVNEVLIESLEIDQVAGLPSRYRYAMKLLEFKEAKEPEKVETEPVEGLEPEEEERTEAMQEEAAQEVELESDIHDIRVRIRDANANPIKEVSVTVDGPEGKHESKTDDEGFVVIEDVKEGKYDISVDDDRFKGLTTKLNVKKKKAKEE